MHDKFYAVRRWDVQDVDLIPKFISILRSVFPKPDEHTRAWFAWKHVDNIWGPSIVTYAETSVGEIVAVRAFWRQSLQLGERTIVAYQPCDTATTAEHRGRGLFKRLTLAAIEASKETNASLLFNYPTGNARSAYISLGWTPVNAVKAWWKPLRTVQALKKCLRIGVRNLESIALPESDWNFNVGNLALPQGANVFVPERPAGYHLWRFGRHPIHRYFVCGRGELKAVVRLRQRGPFVEALIVDLWMEQGRCSTSSVRRLVSDIKNLVDADVCTCVLGSESQFTPFLRKAGFWWAPNDIHHYVRFFESHSAMIHNEGWGIQGAEIDTY